LDGVTALQAAGLQRIESPLIHLAVPKSVTPHQCRGVRVHETRRYREEDVLRVDIPRMRPATAAVHAALWAPSNGEAALFVIAAVQQRLTTPCELAEAVERVRRDPRRNLLRGLLRDVAGGVESFDERAFARLCRKRGLPEPSRQVLCVAANGRVYFDVMWEQYGVIVEIDGIQHLDAAQVVRDALKQNMAAIEGALVLRVPNWALRADPDPFLDQVEAALLSRGWNPALRPAKAM
jgi:very-short-patch-repair endonuclease